MILICNPYKNMLWELRYKSDLSVQKDKIERGSNTCIKVRPILEYDWIIQNVGHNRCCHHTGNLIPFLA